jgi:hypothetical protein
LPTTALPLDWSVTVMVELAVPSALTLVTLLATVEEPPASGKAEKKNTSGKQTENSGAVPTSNV